MKAVEDQNKHIKCLQQNQVFLITQKNTIKSYLDGNYHEIESQQKVVKKVKSCY